MKVNKIQIIIISTLVLLIFSNVAIANNEFKIFKPEKKLITKDAAEKVFQQKRIILESISEKDISHLKSKGCLINKKLKRSTSFECPENIIPDLEKLPEVREARIFHIVDLEADQQINADDVWAEGVNGTGVNVAILDTGIDSSHIELSDSILGCVNFVESEETCNDLEGHGTHVAGIITANGVNKNLVGNNDATGVAPGAGVYMLKVCDMGGECQEADMIAAMEYAVDYLDARVMSMSIGGGNFDGPDCDIDPSTGEIDPFVAKVNWVVDNGISVVAAAGNEGSYVNYPACASKAIAVGAVDENGYVIDWSNYGPSLDIVAPGSNILSTYSCLGLGAGDCGVTWYAYMWGTSMATPHVSGVIALLLDANSSLNDTEIKNALYSTADPPAGCYRHTDTTCTLDDTGAGIVNAYQAYLSVICAHEADTDCDNCVSMNELLSYIGLWKQDPIGVGMNNLLNAIGIWKANPVCA